MWDSGSDINAVSVRELTTVVFNHLHKRSKPVFQASFLRFEDTFGLASRAFHYGTCSSTHSSSSDKWPASFDQGICSMWNSVSFIPGERYMADYLPSPYRI